MTEHKWLKLAGLLNKCIYSKDHKNCPYSKYRKMDHYQRLEALLSISNEQAGKMMKTCLSQQNECEPILLPKKEASWEISVLA